MLYNKIKTKREKIKLTKEKLDWIIKRLSYILDMLNHNKSECFYHISNRKEKIVIDDSVLTVLKIIDEIFDVETTIWVRDAITMLIKGKSDVFIIHKIPIERTKYYLFKKAFKEKIFQCCIAKKMVTYDNILYSKLD